MATLSRRQFCQQTLGLSLAGMMPSIALGENNRNTSPNIIVIFTDDQGYADLSCQGSVNDVRTPNIDRLASEGVRMTSGYITAPQCVPSRAGLLTGRYQQRFGLDANGKGPLPLTEITLPQRLQQAGYATGMVGKWHLSPNHSDKKWIQEHLPNQYSSTSNQRVRIPRNKALPYYPGARGFGDYFVGNSSDYHANFDLNGRSLDPNGETVKTGMYRLDAQSEAALSFIRRHKDQPFFLYLPYFAPHVPLEATEKYLSRFPGDMPERRRYALAMMSAIDDGVGRILDELLQLGIDENTIIFFISDNGAPLKIEKEDRPISFRGGAWDGSLNDPWVGEKGMLSEGGIRVPFLVRWKNVLPKGKTYDAPVISLDVAATALQIAGLEIPQTLDGINLIPYLKGDIQSQPHDHLFWRFWNQSAIRSLQWKYLKAGNKNEFLFDLSSADHEKENVINEYPEIAMNLKTTLATWANQLHEPGIPSKELNNQEQDWYAHYFDSH